MYIIPPPKSGYYSYQEGPDQELVFTPKPPKVPEMLPETLEVSHEMSEEEVVTGKAFLFIGTGAAAYTLNLLMTKDLNNLTAIGSVAAICYGIYNGYKMIEAAQNTDSNE